MTRSLALGILMMGSTAIAAPDGSIPVGVAKVDVTPDFPVRLHGYASRKAESGGVAGKLWVKAMAIGSDESGPSVVVSADNLGVPDAITSEVAARLKAKAGIARERFAVGASHSHTAPVLAGCAPNIFGRPFLAEEREHIDRYTKLFTDAVEAAALAALKDRRPSRLAWGEGSVGFAINRRVVVDGKWTKIGEVPTGPVDHSLPMLRAVDEATGELRAVLVNYACHCTTLNPDDNQIHGDWAGFAQEGIESDHPGAIAMTLIGCGADANPRSRPGLAVAQRHGRELADEVSRLLKGPLKPLSSAPVGTLRRVALPFDRLPTREALDEQVKLGGHLGNNAAIQIAKIERLGALPPAIDYPVQTWRFGDDLAMVFLAGEVVVDYALRLKAEFDPKRIWIVSYANDAPCYIPSERILREGGYEAGGAMLYYGWPSPLRSGVEDIIIGAVRAQVPEAFRKRD